MTLAYPLSMILAEKIVTAVERANVNTRWRDFVDIMTLARGNAIAGDDLLESLHAVAAHRVVRLERLSRAADKLGESAQGKWSAWRRKQRLLERTPAAFAHLLAEVATFADPALEGQIVGLRWSPDQTGWS